MLLVTGGAGFIGSNVAAALVADGHDVVVCDRLRQGEKWRNIAKLLLRDLVSPEALTPWLGQHGADLEAVVHLGAISSTTERDADRIVEVNFRLSQQLWSWCAAHGKRLIYASSAATYGSGEAGFADDDTPAALARLRPLNAYGWSKLLFDRWAVAELAAGRATPAQWVGLKFFNVYGPNEYHKGPMQSVIAQKYPFAATGRPVTLFRSYRGDVPDGGQRRDFVYVGDCVEVIRWLLGERRVNGIFNLGSGKARSFAELAGALYRALGRSPELAYVDMPEEIRSKYQYYTEARMERLRQAGYTRAFTELEDGVQEYVQRFLSQPDPYR